jgi:lipopolysaccharide exporter
VGGALRVGLLLALIPGFGARGAAMAAAIAIGVEQGLMVATALRRFHIGFEALVAQVWRPALATGVMAVVLWGFGLGWAPNDGPESLMVSVVLGVVVFAAALLGAWLLAGRPAGAEADLLGLVERRLG